jgi:uncharacterized membrane protein YraQ (UPF0718 family)
MTTATIGERLRHRPVSEDSVGIAFGLLALALVVARALHVGKVPAVETFTLVLVSIVVEALPFILVGALVSALLAAFVSERAFARAGRLPRAVQLPCAAVGAFAFPVCDCGTVPVARRLLARGLDPAASLTFMFAAPVVNPLVLASTYVAYGGGRRGTEVAVARAVIALVVAAAVGVVVGRTVTLRMGDVAAGEEHEHRNRRDTFATHLTHDFLAMGRFLVIGAAAAAFLQVLVPQSSIQGLAAHTVVAELALIAVAFALSLCSAADAFVAASFGAFGMAPQLAFLAFGPTADAKLTVLYSATFRRSFAARVLVVAVPVVTVAALLAAQVIE